MCYDGNARPPEPPGERRAARARDFVLTASDGNQFNAYLAEPEGEFNAQVLIYPDVRGLHQFYKDLALRFAEVGIPALAMDYFGRTAGLSSRGEEFEYMPHVQQMTFPHFMMDVQACLASLREQTPNTPIFVVGFCRGGTLALLSGTQDFKFAGLIPFYAGLSRPIEGAGGSALDRAHEVRYPVLGLFGGDDPGIPTEQVYQLDEELDKAGVEHNIIVYQGAPHSFFDRKQTEFANESADAWEKVLNFIQAHIGD
jgi:carboxymethylenebutenolidase